MTFAPNIKNQPRVLPNGHGRNIPTAYLMDATELAATDTEDHIDLGGPCGALTATLTVTYADGTLPTLDVIIEHSHDASTWATLLSMTQATAATAETKTIGAVRRYIRGKATLAGTDEVFSFTLSAELDLSYI
jgi:hypothetical protein